ncbi:hypothetical protein NGM37_18145, partial [Streptomyces sp. TRM76130]|nr:hypothetical protein [Streptomyces sp. TRM76130]
PQAPARTFELLDVFTRGRSITVGTQDARDTLMLRLLSFAYLDGTLPTAASSASTPAAPRARSASSSSASSPRPRPWSAP